MRYTLWPAESPNPNPEQILRVGDGWAPGSHSDAIVALAAGVDPLPDPSSPPAFWAIHKYGTASSQWGITLGAVPQP